jgi:hypothetical protein
MDQGRGTGGKQIEVFVKAFERPSRPYEKIIGVGVAWGTVLEAQRAIVTIR